MLPNSGEESSVSLPINKGKKKIEEKNSKNKKTYLII